MSDLEILHTNRLKKIAMVCMSIGALSLAAPAVVKADSFDVVAILAQEALDSIWSQMKVSATEAAGVLQAATIEAGVANQIASDYELMNEQTAAITGAINASMKISAVAQVDALNAHKNTILMGMAASDKLRIADEQSLATLPGASQTARVSEIAGQGIKGASEVANGANLALAKRHLTTKSSQGNVLDYYQKYLTKYLDIGGGDPTMLPNADILADTLLSGAQNKIGVAESMTFNKQQIEAAQDYIANLVDVAPPPDISDDAAKSVEGGRFRMLLRAEKARMGLAFKSFGDALAARTPIPGFNSGAEIGINKDGDISYQEFLTNEIRRRYNNSQWVAQVAGATPANLMREELFMHALEQHLSMEDGRRLEKIELQIAQATLNQIPGSALRQQIEAQRARVMSSVK